MSSRVQKFMGSAVQDLIQQSALNLSGFLRWKFAHLSLAQSIRIDLLVCSSVAQTWPAQVHACTMSHSGKWNNVMHFTIKFCYYVS